MGMSTLAGILRWKFIWESDKYQKSHNSQSRNWAKVQTYASFWVVERFWDGSLKGMLTFNESEFREF